ncbi:hypothetical protein MRX96_018319 [Rhipicephalus microplus]
MAEAGKGSDDKSGEPSDAPQADSEPKKSSMKATKEDGSTSGEKPKKKKKKSAEDLATHGNLGKIASEAASNRDTSTGSVKKPKGGKKSSSKEGKSDGKANATKKSSSKEGKSAGKASAVKKGRHSKVGLETLSGSEAKDAIKGKKSRKKEKEEKACRFSAAQQSSGASPALGSRCISTVIFRLPTGYASLSSPAPRYRSMRSCSFRRQVPHKPVRVSSRKLELFLASSSGKMHRSIPLRILQQHQMYQLNCILHYSWPLKVNRCLMAPFNRCLANLRLLVGSYL